MIRKLILIILTMVLLFSCQKDDLSSQIEDFDNSNKAVGEMIVLGEKLDNPYSVKNMKLALDNLQNESGNVSLKSAGVDEYEIEASHLYVRFLPEDTTQMKLLNNDTTLELFDYPLDYEIEQEGQYYHDPEIAEEKYTWLYTAVPIDYEFPNINYEIIEECFIPDEDEEEISLKSTLINEFFFANLEDEAFRITGNLDESEEDSVSNQATPRWGRSSKKEPKGTFRVHNTFTDIPEGIRGVKVRAHRIVKIKSTHTNDDGYYHIKKGFRHNVHMAIIFENNKNFKIWGNRAFFAPAKHNEGWVSKSGKSRDFYRSSAVWKWATVNNAVDKYRDYCDEYSFSKPPSGLRVWVFDKDQDGISGSASMIRRTWGIFGFTGGSKFVNFLGKANEIYLSVNALAIVTKFMQPDITISFNSDNSIKTDDVYRTVFHECAHASHWEKVRSSYWRKYINYIITYFNQEDNSVYGDGTGQNAGYCGVGEMWGNYIGALFVRDEFNLNNWSGFTQGEDWYNPGFLRRVDDINDVTTSEIYDCLDATSISSLVEKLKTKTENDEEIDNAYNAYTDWP